MTPADLEIVEVVGGRDLHRAGAFLGISIVVADDRNAPANQGKDRDLADQVLQAPVLWMYRHRGIAKHGFRPRGGDRDEFVSPLDRIADMPQAPSYLDLLHF